MNYLYMGSGEYARDVLGYITNEEWMPLAVITRPDRPSGRGLRVRPTPVAELAERIRLKLYKPEALDASEFEGLLRSHRPDFVLVCDYGNLIPEGVLSLMPQRFLNLHPSLLPRYRGAAPIRRALMDGASRTGVSLMVMDEGLDTGPVVRALEVEVLPADDAETLRRRLAERGAELIRATVPAYLEGRLRPREQDSGKATYAPPLRKEELYIDWNEPAAEIHNRIRALSPSPGARGRLGGRWIKILRSRPREEVLTLRPGEIVAERGGEMLVGTGRGALQVLLLQPEGRRRMEASEFLRGYRGGKGESFETVSENV